MAKRVIVNDDEWGFDDLLSSGSTLLNLACTDNALGAFIKGRFYLLCGESSAGKTFVGMTCFAEAARNPNFDDYDLIHDDVEGGALMDKARYFGEDAAARMEPPSEHGSSDTIESFYDNVLDRLDSGRPFLYFCDSMDALASKYEITRFDENRKARKKGTKEKADRTDQKAKINSTTLRRVHTGLKRTGSILIMVCQARDKMDAGLFEFPQTYSGGRSLQFYASLQIWLNKGKAITKTVKGDRKKKIGSYGNLTVRKNRVTGKDRFVHVPFYNAFGIDDVGSIIDFLTAEGHWTKTNGVIRAPEFKRKANKAKLVEYIEQNDLEEELAEIAQDAWETIEAALVPKRKQRY